MGRRRKSDNHLPPRVYKHGAGYRYVPLTGKPEPLGNDLGEALKKYASLLQGENFSGAEKDSVAWLLEWYLANISTVAPRNSPVTIADKRVQAVELTKRIGHIPLRLLRPFHVRDYLDLGINEKRPVRANREKALLSHACTVAVGKGWIDVNPCIQVTRNHETKRTRYIEDHEMTAVLAMCSPQLKAVAQLIYRTLQRPGDILQWSAANIVTRDGQRVLRFQQSKTGARLEIAITPDIDAIFESLRDGRTVVGMTLIHNRRAQAYTMSGIKGMWNKACHAAGVSDFGIYDLKGKGATDMYRDGVPLTLISALCGHQSVTTTETYIKARITDVIQPNKRVVGE